MHSLSLFREFLCASVHCMQWMGVLVVFGFFNFSLQLEVEWENVVCQVQIWTSLPAADDVDKIFWTPGCCSPSEVNSLDEGCETSLEETFIRSRANPEMDFEVMNSSWRHCGPFFTLYSFPLAGAKVTTTASYSEHLMHVRVCKKCHIVTKNQWDQGTDKASRKAIFYMFQQQRLTLDGNSNSCKVL